MDDGHSGLLDLGLGEGFSRRQCEAQLAENLPRLGTCDAKDGGGCV